MNILVTGGAGYIGSRLVPFLTGHGYGVAVWDADTAKSASNHDFFDARKMPIHEVLKTRRYNTVVHLVGTYSKDADISHDINFRLTVDAFHACNQHGTGSFVFMSTCGVLNPEDHSEYTRQKLLAEAALLDASKDNSCRLHILRLAPVYGLAPRMKFDSIVNGFIRDAISQACLDVWGKDEHRPVVDICTVLDEILKVIQTRGSGKVIQNIATGNFTKGEIVQEIKKLCPGIEIILRGNDKKGYTIEPTIAGRSLAEGVREVLNAKIL